jgi:branched-chain amino acid transport system permease protein
MIQGVGDIHASDAVFSVPTSVRILAVVVLARFVSVRMAIVGAAAIGMAQEATRWSYHSTVVLDGSLLAVIALALLLQRRRMSRAELAQTIGWQADREIRPIPRELRGLPSVRNWVRTVIIGSLVVALGVPWILNASQLDQMTLALLYAMICLSLLVLTGWSGQISLGQVALAGVGAWAAAWSGLPFPLALLIGAVGGAIAATLVGIPALRLRGLNLAIITLAFAVTVSSFVLDRGYLGGHLPARLNRPSVLGLNLDDQRTHYYVILVILALVTMAVLGMRRSRTARAFIALRDNEQAAQSFAIAATRARLSSFAISGAIAGLAGTLIAYTDGAVDPSRFTPDFGVTLFLGAVIGGFGSVLGPILGGLYVGVLPLLGNVGQDIGQFGGIGGLALILTVGGGLSQLFFRMRDGMLRRVANRHGVVVPSLVADLLTDGRRRLVPIAAKRRDGGGTAFVPQRYRLSDQWAFGESGPVRQLDDALVATSPAWVEAVPDGSH